MWGLVVVVGGFGCFGDEVDDNDVARVVCVCGWLPVSLSAVDVSVGDSGGSVVGGDSVCCFV